MKKLSYLTIFMLLVTSFAGFLYVRPVNAAPLTEVSVRLDRMGAGEETGANYYILVVAKPASTATEDAVQVVFPVSSAFTVDSTASNIDVTTTGIPSTYQGESLTAWPGIGTEATDVSSGTVTFASDDLTAGTLYGFFITSGITNPSSGNAGTHSIVVNTRVSAATQDTGTAAVDIVDTDDDQVTVTATIGPTFNFALSGNSIALGALDSSSVTTGNVTVDVDTNAQNGWTAWLRSEGSDAELASAATGDSIASTGTVNGATETVNAGTENYVVDVAVSQGGSSSGTTSVSVEYDGNGTTTGGTLSTTYQQIAQSTGQAVSDTLTLTAIVAVATTTQAATDYTDTWEVIGAGNF